MKFDIVNSVIEILLENDDTTGIVINLTGNNIRIIPSKGVVLPFINISKKDWFDFKNDIRVRVSDCGMSKTALSYCLTNNLITETEQSDSNKVTGKEQENNRN